MAKKYYWLKLQQEFFRDKEIKKLRKIAGGDTYTVIYLKLMLMSINQDGKLFFDGVEDTFAEELALELDEDVDNIKITMMFLIKTGLMIEVSENECLLTKVPEYIGSETNKAKLMRNKRSRDKQNALESGNNVTVMLPDVTNCYTEKSESESESEKKDKSDSKRIDYQLIADMYNEICISFPKVRAISETRKKAIKARFNAGYTVEDFKTLFHEAQNSSFLKGQNNRNWTATFDWLIADANMAKTLDGNYRDKDKPSTGKKFEYNDNFEYGVDSL